MPRVSTSMYGCLYVLCTLAHVCMYIGGNIKEADVDMHPMYHCAQDVTID